MVLVLFPMLRPSSYCEWVFHLSMLWVYSLQGIHRKLVALPKSLTVSVSMNTFMQSIHLRMISNGNACSTKKKKAIKQRNHLYNFHIYIYIYIFLFLHIYWFWFFSASQHIWSCVIILSLLFGSVVLITTWYCLSYLITITFI